MHTYLTRELGNREKLKAQVGFRTSGYRCDIESKIGFNTMIIH